MLCKIPGVSALGRSGYTRYEGSHHWGEELYKIPGVSSVGSRQRGEREGDPYKIPGVSSLGKQAIRDTRDLISGVRGLVYESIITSVCIGESLALI